MSLELDWNGLGRERFREGTKMVRETAENEKIYDGTMRGLCVGTTVGTAVGTRVGTMHVFWRFSMFFLLKEGRKIQKESADI